MLRRGALVAALAALAGSWAAAAPAAASVELSAGFDRGAVLGEATALRIGLQVDSRRAPSPVSEVRLLYPRSLGVVSSGLGLATCTQPASHFVEVIVVASGLDGCPRNSVMGYGTLVAEVRLSDGQVVPEHGTLALLSGPIADGVLELVVQIDGLRPFGGRLVLGGQVAGAAAPYGGAIAVRVPVIPSLVGVAEIALTDLRLTVGDPRIRYEERVRGRIVRYRPEGIVLPRRCPGDGFRFRARVRFDDGGRATASAVVPCPRAAPPVRG